MVGWGRELEQIRQGMITMMGRRRGNRMVKFFFLFCTFVCFSVSFPARAETPSQEIVNENILVISSDNASNNWNNDLMTGLRSCLEKTGRSLAIDVLELNIAGTPELRPRETEVASLRSRLEEVRYHLIITSGNAAADLFFDGDLTIPSDTPFLFFNYQCFRLNHRTQRPGMTGLTMPESSARNIRLGMKLFPQTEKIVVILDGGVYGESIRRCVMDRQWPEGTPEIEFVSGRDYSTPEMLRKLATLPEKSFVVLNRWQSAKEAKVSQPVKLIPRIQEHYSGPILGTLTFQLDLGVMGGVMADGFRQGSQIAGIADRILSGEDAGTIPVSEGDSRTLFDWSQLVKYGISPDRLPADAEICNVPPSWYDLYHREILWCGIFLGSLLVVSLVWLVLSIRHAKRLYVLSERFRLTLTSIGDAVIATDADAVILNANPVAARLCGLPSESMIGRNVDDVLKLVHYPTDEPVESPLRVTLREKRAVELANHTDLLSADGSRYHIADSATPVRDEQGQVIGAVIVFRDVTQAYQQRARLRDALTSLEYASELSHAAYFRMNVRTREVTGSKLLPELWKISDHRAVPSTEFVCSEDLPAFRRITEQLYQGECEV
ncbi:MAG: PAS domain-containing protein, partial [Planctomycetia bacterium]|nr:PAS domain-containing protein [Planctomycetia bacterium]